MKTNKNVVITAGVLMFIASLINYILNDDIISFGIFAFAGFGFISQGTAEYMKQDTTKQRVRKLSGLFFVLAVLVFVYWLLAGKLHWI